MDGVFAGVHWSVCRAHSGHVWVLHMREIVNAPFATAPKLGGAAFPNRVKSKTPRNSCGIPVPQAFQQVQIRKMRNHGGVLPAQQSAVLSGGVHGRRRLLDASGVVHPSRDGGDHDAGISVLPSTLQRETCGRRACRAVTPAGHPPPHPFSGPAHQVCRSSWSPHPAPCDYTRTKQSKCASRRIWLVIFTAADDAGDFLPRSVH